MPPVAKPSTVDLLVLGNLIAGPEPESAIVFCNALKLAKERYDKRLSFGPAFMTTGSVSDYAHRRWTTQFREARRPPLVFDWPVAVEIDVQARIVTDQRKPRVALFRVRTVEHRGNFWCGGVPKVDKN